MFKCRECKIDYVYDEKVGYSKDLCGPLCDGIERGRKQAVTIDIEISKEFGV